MNCGGIPRPVHSEQAAMAIRLLNAIASAPSRRLVFDGDMHHHLQTSWRAGVHLLSPAPTHGFGAWSALTVGDHGPWLRICSNSTRASLHQLAHRFLAMQVPTLCCVVFATLQAMPVRAHRLVRDAKSVIFTPTRKLNTFPTAGLALAPDQAHGQSHCPINCGAPRCDECP